MSFFDDVAATARRQHGLITIEQVRRSGVSAQELRTLTLRGILIRRHRGLYAIAGAQHTWEQELLAAVLVSGPHAAAGARAAAGMWRLHRYRRNHIDVAVPRRARRHPHEWTTYEMLHLPSRDLTVVDSIPTTTPTLTLIDVARFVGPGRLGSMVDDAVTRSLTSYEDLHRRFGELARRGRDGIATMRTVLEERPCGAVAPDSGFEASVMNRLRSIGFDRVLHHRVEAKHHHYVLDIAWPDYKVAIECDGFRFHRTEEQLVWDDQRRNALTLMGWVVLHETYQRFRRDPGAIVLDASAALRLHGAPL